MKFVFVMMKLSSEEKTLKTFVEVMYKHTATHNQPNQLGIPLTDAGLSVAFFFFFSLNVFKYDVLHFK